MPIELLSNEKALELDRLAEQAGYSIAELMERAGGAVARAVTRHYPPLPVLIICGPGNNGGDGLVAARRLLKAGWEVSVCDLASGGRRSSLNAQMLKSLTNACLPHHDAFQLLEISACKALLSYGKIWNIVIDAAFGAGLARELAPSIASLFSQLQETCDWIVAVDISSGVHGSDGTVQTGSMKADLTVSFVRPKQGHFLQPGKSFTGNLVIADLGMPHSIVEKLLPLPELTAPLSFSITRMLKNHNTHKYNRGYVLVIGGPRSMTGAARLAATAALKTGAGIVSIACHRSSLDIYAAHTTEIVLRPYKEPEELFDLINAKAPSCIVIGPGLGMEDMQLVVLEHLLTCGLQLVIDADAIRLIANNAERLISLLSNQMILTPHDAEFNHLVSFEGNKLEKTQQAAKYLGCHILYKGNDTVIASPDGQARICADAPATLATAGSGDVLAGITASLVSQGSDPFNAAAGAAALHGRAARRLGENFSAADLLSALN